MSLVTLSQGRAAASGEATRSLSDRFEETIFFLIDRTTCFTG